MTSLVWVNDVTVYIMQARFQVEVPDQMFDSENIQQNARTLAMKERKLLELERSTVELKASIDQLRKTIKDQRASRLLVPSCQVPIELSRILLFNSLGKNYEYFLGNTFKENRTRMLVCKYWLFVITKTPGLWISCSFGERGFKTQGQKR
jgi:hypothetical protein